MGAAPQAFRRRVFRSVKRRHRLPRQDERDRFVAERRKEHKSYFALRSPASSCWTCEPVLTIILIAPFVLAAVERQRNVRDDADGTAASLGPRPDWKKARHCGESCDFF